MNNAAYRRNVFKTLSQKPAKLGLKLVARDTRRTNIFHATCGVAAETLELVKGMAPYMVGASKFTEPMKINAFEETGDLFYFVTVLAHMLKVKLPPSGKKIKTKAGTRSETVLQLAALAGDMLNQVKKNFYGPVMKLETRTKDLHEIDAKGVKTGKVTQNIIEVEVVNAEATEAMFQERETALALVLSAYIELLWAFCLDAFDVTPANLYVGNTAKLAKRYPGEKFELEDSEERDPEDEIAAMKAMAEAAKPKVKVVVKKPLKLKATA